MNRPRTPAANTVADTPGAQDEWDRANEREAARIVHSRRCRPLLDDIVWTLALTPPVLVVLLILVFGA